MFKNHVIIAWRNLWKHKMLSIINISGLAIGVATCLTIMLVVWDELSYDRYNEHADQIVRVVLRGKVNGESIKEAITQPPVARTLQDEFPEVLQGTRLRDSGSPQITYQKNTFRDSKFAFVDANFFNVFTLPLIKGDAITALKEPNSVVITQAQAFKYFGNENPLGKVLDLKEWEEQFKVTGVIDKVPDNSHFHFDFFGSMEGLDDAKSLSWVESYYHSYLLLDEGVDNTQLEKKLPQIIDKYMGPQMKDMGMPYAEFKEKGNIIGLFLQPLTDIHLRSDFAGNTDLEPGGDVKKVYIFSVIALFILFIACINYINLSTAAASKRSREVGIKKVLGSYKIQLIKQFLTESFMITLVAMVMAGLLIALFLPLFNNLTDKTFQLTDIFNAQTFLYFSLFGVVISLLSGGYPAFFIASFTPMSVLKNKHSNTGGASGIRNGLVVFQFMISAGLITASLVVNQQMSYIQNKDIGYNKDQILVLRDSWALGSKETVLKTQLLGDSRVERITMSGHIPAGPTNNHMSSFYLGLNSDDARRMTIYEIDDQYIPTMGMDLVAGRNFSNDFGSETSNIIINETSAKIFGIADDALDQTVTMSTDNEGGSTAFTVIGIIKDFHFRSLHQLIDPLIMINRPNSGLIVRASTSDMPGLISTAQKLWKDFKVEEPFSYELLDDSFKQVYRTEQNLATLIKGFAMLAIFIACMGLFGLVTFTTEQRFKEIGIRKVLGSSVSQIVSMLSKDFLKLVLVSMLMAFPISYYLMNQWLQDFAYRIEIQWRVFAVVGLVTVIIAFLTISIKSIAAALANPVDSLRNE